MRMGGALIAFDPVLSTRLRGFVPRLAPPGISRERFPAVDYVLVSHNHFDHLDLPSLPYMGRSATYVVPLGMGALLSPIGPKRVVELDWWQSHRDGGLEITLVPARHWSMRSPWDRNDSLWGGFVVRADEGAAYHAGDTAHFDGFRDIRERVGPIDWAMLPIGAYEPRWFMKPQHMDPDEALDAFTALGAKNFVAMHWGTFLLTDEPTHEPPARVRQGFVDRGVSVERLWVMDIGETRPLVTT